MDRFEPVSDKAAGRLFPLITAGEIPGYGRGLIFKSSANGRWPRLSISSSDQSSIPDTYWFLRASAAQVVSDLSRKVQQVTRLSVSSHPPERVSESPVVVEMLSCMV